jgi:hypothetical protein
MGRKRQAVRIKTGPELSARLLSVVSIAWQPVVIWVLPALVLVAACSIGLYVSRSHVIGSPNFRVAASRVNLVNLPNPAPAWWDRSFADQVSHSAAFAAGSSMLDDALLPRIADAARQCPWVRTVQSVQKRYPNQIEVSVVLRMPAAAVVCSDGRGNTLYLLADEEGVRIPKTCAQWPTPGLKVPCIIGVAAPPPQPGEAWRESSIAEAIQIARSIQSSSVISRSLTVVMVDVTNYAGRRDRGQSEFLLLADNNCVIEWGRAPGTSRPGELPVAEKLSKLERFIKEGKLAGNQMLGVRFAGPVVVSRRYNTDGDRNS